MSEYIVIGTRELHWHDDMNAPNEVVYDEMVVRVRMFFGARKSVDEDFYMPKGMDHHTDYSVLDQALKDIIEARMAEIQNGVHDTNSDLVPNQKEVVVIEE